MKIDRLNQILVEKGLVLVLKANGEPSLAGHKANVSPELLAVLKRQRDGVIDWLLIHRPPSMQSYFDDDTSSPHSSESGGCNSDGDECEPEPSTSDTDTADETVAVGNGDSTTEASDDPDDFLAWLDAPSPANATEPNEPAIDSPPEANGDRIGDNISACHYRDDPAKPPSLPKAGRSVRSLSPSFLWVNGMTDEWLCWRYADDRMCHANNGDIWLDPQHEPPFTLAGTLPTDDWRIDPRIPGPEQLFAAEQSAKDAERIRVKAVRKPTRKQLKADAPGFAGLATSD